MRWTYDASVDALYVYLLDAPIERQIETDLAIADITKDDRVVGIEVLGASLCFDAERISEQLHLDLEDRGALRFLETSLRQTRFGLGGPSRDSRISNPVTASQPLFDASEGPVVLA